MIGILDAIKMAAAAVAAIALCSIVNSVWMLPAARDEGREMERADALKKSIELLQRRSKTNAEIRSLSPGVLCTELGGKWVLEHCE